jgi:hypothetical protein
MKASELRIVNYYNQFGNIHQANGTVISQLEIAPKDQLWCKAIPLTEEWLLKFGFQEYLSPTDLRINIASGILLQFHFGVNKIECWIGDEISRPDLIYVHQLQNLFHALTGEELTITES